MYTAVLERILGESDRVGGEGGTVVQVRRGVEVTQVHVPSGVFANIVVETDERDELILVNSVEVSGSGLNSKAVVETGRIVVTLNGDVVGTTAERPLVASFPGEFTVDAVDVQVDVVLRTTETGGQTRTTLVLVALVAEVNFDARVIELVGYAESVVVVRTGGILQGRQVSGERVSRTGSVNGGVREPGEHRVDETRCVTDNGVGRSSQSECTGGDANIVEAGILLVEESEFTPNSTTTLVESPSTFETETFTVVRVLLSVVQGVQSAEVVDVGETLNAYTGRVSEDEGVVGGIHADVFTSQVQVSVEEVHANTDAESIAVYIVTGVTVRTVVGVAVLAVDSDLVAFADVESVSSAEAPQVHALSTEATTDECVVESVSTGDRTVVGGASRAVVGLLESGLLSGVETRRVNPLKGCPTGSSTGGSVERNVVSSEVGTSTGGDVTGLESSAAERVFHYASVVTLNESAFEFESYVTTEEPRLVTVVEVAGGRKTSSHNFPVQYAPVRYIDLTGYVETVAGVELRTESVGVELTGIQDVVHLVFRESTNNELGLRRVVNNPEVVQVHSGERLVVQALYARVLVVRSERVAQERLLHTVVCINESITLRSVRRELSTSIDVIADTDAQTEESARGETGSVG